LEELILDGNELGLEFYLQLHKELIEVQSIKKLSLKECNINSEKAEVLLEAITVNISLESVNLT